ncbi:L-histidine N(alpha)-methyltransferase [Sphaerimonospora cavernae]|uniref:Histidine N-alpha-methyltransferase n=1 Tax=Sphaerimonospora cavernae TaxID=1740611 RepID=A0ABV6U5J6_9ACTN
MAVIDRLDDDYLRQALEHDVRTGLTATPKWLPPKWFYDETGSALFSAITHLPEYYPTRRELEILRRHVFDIAARSRADTLIELGSGTSEKTVLLLDALAAEGTLRAYTPVDVDVVTLEAAAGRLSVRYPRIELRPVRADFEAHLALLPSLLPTPGRRMVAFLGGTIGNLPPTAREVFLKELRATLRPGDMLLLGTDLVKDVARLVAAYDDALGVTAEFNRNVLRVLNRELDADFQPDAFEHVAIYDEDNEWIEMRLRAARPMRVAISALGLAVSFDEGEEIRTEISAKFREEGVAGELTRAGFAVTSRYTDPAGDFALTLASASPMSSLA